jgi:hypothetical protein
MKRAEVLSDLLVLLGVHQMLQNRCVARVGKASR